MALVEAADPSRPGVRLARDCDALVPSCCPPERMLELDIPDAGAVIRKGQAGVGPGVGGAEDAEGVLEAAVRALVPNLAAAPPGILRAEAARLAAGAGDGSPDWRFRGEGHLCFGPVSLRPSQVFLRSRLSRAFVNIKPVLPGHVLVAPARCVARVADLGADELADLFETARLAGRVVERAHAADALQMSVQDGAAAGQSVPHVHVHVLPRRDGDLPAGDDVYAMLEASAACVRDAAAAGAAGDAAALDEAWGGLVRVGTAGDGDASTRLDPAAASGSGPSLRDAASMADEAAWYRRAAAEQDPKLGGAVPRD